MTKKQIKNLVLQSYVKESLDAEKIASIASLLTRFQLKQYIRVLKSSENQKTVNITLSHLPTKTHQEMISHLFPGKKIIYDVDSTLLVGIQIVNNDLVYSLNLKDTLDNLLSHVSSDL